MPQIILENPSLGGLADSGYLGPANSMAAMVGLDVHSEPGIIKVNQRLVKDSGATVDVRINKIVSCTDGSVYLFGDSGKVFKRDSAGTYTTARVVAPATGGNNIVGALEYDGFVYYATQNKVGRWQIGTAWSSANDNYATFSFGNANFHQMTIQNLVLFIGDGNFIAQVDNDQLDGSGTISTSGTAVTGVGTKFLTEAAVLGYVLYTDADGNITRRQITAIADNTHLTLASGFSPDLGATTTYQITKHIFTNQDNDVPLGMTVKSLGQIGVELLFGTQNKPWAEIYRWNTWSPSFSASDQVPETGVNCFLQTDNFVLVQAGTLGNLYQYSGDLLQLIKKVPGDYTGGKTASAENEARAWFRGLSMIGMSSVGGGTLAGVYSFGNVNPSYPKILNLEYPLSTGNFTGDVITAMEQITDSSGDIMLVAWKNGATYGVDRVDLANKYATAYLQSRVITNDRNVLKRIIEIDVAYRTIPAGTSIKFFVSKNHGAFAEIQDKEDDAIRQVYRTTVSVDDCATYQIQVQLIPNVNSAPEIEKVIINI